MSSSTLLVSAVASHLPPGKRGLKGVRDSIGHRDGADLDLVGVFERNGMRDSLSVHLCSVLAAQILDRRFRRRHENPRVAAREIGGIDADGTLRVAADDVRAI